MKNKGFTLNELLPVIVILAIIALIAVPVIMGIVESARKGSFEDSGYGMIKAAEITYMNKMSEGFSGDITFTYENGEESNSDGLKLEYKGKRPTSRFLKLYSDGNVELALYDKKYCALKGRNAEKISVSEENEEICGNEIMPPTIIVEGYGVGDTITISIDAGDTFLEPTVTASDVNHS